MSKEASDVKAARKAEKAASKKSGSKAAPDAMDVDAQKAEQRKRKKADKEAAAATNGGDESDRSADKKASKKAKKEAKAAKGFYVEPEAKLAFVIRIRGLNKIHPKVCLRGFLSLADAQSLRARRRRLLPAVLNTPSSPQTPHKTDEEDPAAAAPAPDQQRRVCEGASCF